MRLARICPRGFPDSIFYADTMVVKGSRIGTGNDCQVVWFTDGMCWCLFGASVYGEGVECQNIFFDLKVFNKK